MQQQIFATVHRCLIISLHFKIYSISIQDSILQLYLAANSIFIVIFKLIKCILPLNVQDIYFCSPILNITNKIKHCTNKLKQHC